MDRASDAQAALAEERLAACKKYMKVDYPDDDELIAALMDAANRYLEGAGVNRDAAPAMYDLIVHDMTLRTYDGRDDDAEHAATAPLVRSMLTQLKLRCQYGEEAAADGSAGG